MTLSTRNRFFAAAFFATLPALAVLLFMFPQLARTAASAVAAAEMRSAGVIAAFSARLMQPSPSAVLTALPLICLYSAGTIALLYYFFEKTQTPEILFFAFFAFSFIVETARIAVPLSIANEWPPAVVVAVSRTISFGRFFGILALFSASVYSNGVDFQKHGRVLIIIGIVALSLATGIPVDGLNYDSSFTPISGYRSMVDLTELAIALIAALSFLVAAYTKSAREFYAAAIGTLLIVVGRDLLLRGDSWTAVPVGALMLYGGTWIFAANLHRYYLWL